LLIAYLLLNFIKMIKVFKFHIRRYKLKASLKLICCTFSWKNKVILTSLELWNIMIDKFANSLEQIIYDVVVVKLMQNIYYYRIVNVHKLMFLNKVFHRMHLVWMLIQDVIFNLVKNLHLNAFVSATRLINTYIFALNRWNCAYIAMLIAFDVNN